MYLIFCIISIYSLQKSPWSNVRNYCLQNAILPAGFRQRDQTKKSPTGPFDRNALLDYLEKQALEHQDREDLVPFTGEKKGTAPCAFVKWKHNEEIIQWGELELKLNLCISI